MPRYIDADALKDVIQQHDYPLADSLNSIDNGMFTLGIFQAIDQMPTISPDEARGVGKWVQNDNGTWSCSECHSWIPDEQHYYARFCLFCGAKMEVSEDD